MTTDGDLVPIPWQPRTLGAMLDRAAERWPEQEALVVEDRRATFAELARDVDRMAAVLRAVGVRRGEHVALCMGNSLEWVAAFYAAARLGAVTVPVNTRFKTDELRYVLRQADISTLIIADRFLGKIDFIAMLREIEPAIDMTLPGAALPLLRNVLVVGDDVPAGAYSLRDLLDHTDNAERINAASADDILLIQYTSGTTSFPKGVMLTHDSMLRNAANVAQRLGVRPGDRYFASRPFFHVAGTTLSLLVALQAGACLLTLPTFDAGASLRVMESERCTLVSGNDTILLMMMSHPNFERTRLTIRGGTASAGPEVFRQAVERMGAHELCNPYGLSEASPNIAIADWRDDVEIRIAGFGHVHDGVEVRTVDPATGHDTTPGVPGEILVRGWSLMRGYYNMPEQTAKAIDAGGWLHTGDLGEMSPDGLLRFVGRLKDMLRVGGENVAPAEVEEVLHGHPAVRKAEVIGVPEPRLGEVVAAYVQLREGHDADPDELIAFCRARCANFKVPRYLRIVPNFDDIGMTSSNKVQKNKLREYALRDLGLGP